MWEPEGKIWVHLGQALHSSFGKVKLILDWIFYHEKLLFVSFLALPAQKPRWITVNELQHYCTSMLQVVSGEKDQQWVQKHHMLSLLLGDDRCVIEDIVAPYVSTKGRDSWAWISALWQKGVVKHDILKPISIHTAVTLTAFCQLSVSVIP